jgi:tRNA threonylcarbamoyladenosine biosynthesis protein TsaE
VSLLAIILGVTDQTGLMWISDSIDQTVALGFALGQSLAPGDVVTLSGDLGAGKTTLVRGLAAGWGALDPVNSPTFVLVNVYARADGASLYHLDCYRLRSAADAAAIGLDDLLDDAAALVLEWPEHVLAALPDDRLRLTLVDTGADTRQVTAAAGGPRSARLLAAVTQKVR